MVEDGPGDPTPPTTPDVVVSPDATAPALLPPVEIWAAIHTKPRCERKVCSALDRAHASYYLPRVQRRHTYGTRVRIATVPLFTGYLFYDYGSVDRYYVLRSYGVVRVVSTKDPARLGSELSSLARALAVEGAKPRPVMLGPPGTPVEVINGPLIGCRGTLVRRGRETNLVLTIGFLGFGAEVTIDEAFVRPLEAAPPA